MLLGIILLFNIFAIVGSADWPDWIRGDKGCARTQVRNNSQFNITVKVTNCTQSDTSEGIYYERTIPHGYGEWFPAKVDTVLRIYKVKRQQVTTGKAKKKKKTDTESNDWPWAFDVLDPDGIITCEGSYEQGTCFVRRMATKAPGDKWRRLNYRNTFSGGN